MISACIRQMFIALRIALSGLRKRWWPALNAVLGTACVVGMLAAVLSIAAGYQEAVQLAGAQDRVIVMRSGARSEMESSLSAEQVNLIVHAIGGGPSTDKVPLAAGESYAIANISDRRSGKPMNVAVRGVQPASFALRESLRLVQGRMLNPGRREIIVGRRAQQYFAGLDLNSQFDFAGGAWTVVGVFEAAGGVVESEIWADGPMVQAAYQRGDSVQLVFARLRAGATTQDFAHTVNRDPRVNVSVTTEADYYAEQAGDLSSFVKTLGYAIAALMSVGAIFAALNTGHASIIARTKELATLHALGIDNRGLLGSIVVESVLLALLGGCLGALVAYVMFDGRLASTLFFSKDFSQVVFAFSVTGAALGQAALGALLIGVLGGIGPALQVRRLSIARALAGPR